MIVAERKIRYDSDQFNNKERLNKVRKSKSRSKVKAISRLIVIFIVLVIVISRFAIIAEYNYKISRLETQLTEVRKAGERLSLELVQSEDIEWIEEYAREELGMVYPDNRDIVYIAVDKPLTEAAAQDTVQEYGFNGWTAVLSGKAGSIASEN